MVVMLFLFTATRVLFCLQLNPHGLERRPAALVLNVIQIAVWLVTDFALRPVHWALNDNVTETTRDQQKMNK